MNGEILMRLHSRHLRRACGIGFGLAGFGLLTCGLFWPASVEQLFRSRLGVVLLGIWCISSGGLFHAKVRAGLALGFCEFCKAVREVVEEIRRAMGGDDDDGPSAT
jgi:hypothetical protein